MPRIGKSGNALERQVLGTPWRGASEVYSMRINAAQTRAEPHAQVVITKPFANKTFRNYILGAPRRGMSGNYEAHINAAPARAHTLTQIIVRLKVAITAPKHSGSVGRKGPGVASLGAPWRGMSGNALERHL